MSQDTLHTVMRLRVTRRSDLEVTPAGAATRPFEEARWPADPLALDPLSPTVGRRVRDTPSQPDPWALDPLGSIPRFRWGR